MAHTLSRTSSATTDMWSDAALGRVSPQAVWLTAHGAPHHWHSSECTGRHHLQTSLIARLGRVGLQAVLKGGAPQMRLCKLLTQGTYTLYLGGVGQQAVLVDRAAERRDWAPLRHPFNLSDVCFEPCWRGAPAHLGGAGLETGFIDRPQRGAVVPTCARHHHTLCFRVLLLFCVDRNACLGGVGLQAVFINRPQHGAAAGGAHRIAAEGVEVQLLRQHLQRARFRMSFVNSTRSAPGCRQRC